FLLYFLAYPIRHLTLPVGFDPPWYVWRAEHLTALGVGTGEPAARPGHPVLSAIHGSPTGPSQLETTAAPSLLLVALLALAAGAGRVGSVALRSRLALGEGGGLGQGSAGPPRGAVARGGGGATRVGGAGRRGGVVGGGPAGPGRGCAPGPVQDDRDRQRPVAV